MAQVSINFYSGTTCLIPKIIEIQFIMVVRYNVFIIILSYKKVAQGIYSVQKFVDST
jgi:hypothetical protein